MFGYPFIKMLTIRPTQIEAFRDDLLCDWLRRYLQSCYPIQVKKLGHTALIGLIQSSYHRARTKAFAEPDQIRKYVHVSFLLGTGFEERFPWAGQIMENREYKLELARLRALEDAALRHIKACAAADARR